MANNQFALKKHRQIGLMLHVTRSPENEKSLALQKGLLLPALQNQTIFVPLDKDVNLTCYTILPEQNAGLKIEWWHKKHPNSTARRLQLAENANQYNFRASYGNEGYYTCATDTDQQVSLI